MAQQADLAVVDSEVVHQDHKLPLKLIPYHQVRFFDLIFFLIFFNQKISYLIFAGGIGGGLGHGGGIGNLYIF
jgi:hypothetical protein